MVCGIRETRKKKGYGSRCLEGRFRQVWFRHSERNTLRSMDKRHVGSHLGFTVSF